MQVGVIGFWDSAADLWVFWECLRSSSPVPEGIHRVPWKHKRNTVMQLFCCCFEVFFAADYD